MKTTPEKLEELKALAEHARSPFSVELAEEFVNSVPSLITALEEAQRRISISEAFAKELSSELITARKQLAEAQAPHINSAHSYVQEVPDHCDRITWRGRYFHLHGINSIVALDAAIAEAIADEKHNPWKLAIIEGLIVNHILNAAHESDPVKALTALVDWECKAALDPTISKEAQELVAEYAADAKRYRKIFSEIPHVYTLCVYGAPCIDKATADALLDQQVVI